MTEIKKEDDAQIVAKNILKALREPVLVGNEHFIVETSIGISFYSKNGDEAEQLIKKADSAMYIAKKQSVDSDLKLHFYGSS